ncbi:transcriptional regulator [Vibrio sinaloensis DSM 21326]|uniref:Transcriptional regulator n=1 Tax=Vibrio sinaloensis DSM 21326 TaxID=945550 RepID=E8M6N2_PHOS4|nr:TetR/AcrR family transcriptional regulator [Vibrio sinaloensis]EGA70350.1 transcriptional regulator [Vibrio sinaloensis DSM 21326]
MARKSKFDRNEKLHQAMELFWRKGYANTAISDLVEVLEINRFSLYNTYGDKQQLYYEALDTYLKQVQVPSINELDKPSANIAELSTFLLDFAAIQRERHCGCFMQNALVEHAGEDDVVLKAGNGLFDHLLNIISRAIANGQQDDRVISHLPSEQLASLVLSHMQGMRVLGKAFRYDDIDQATSSLLTLLEVRRLN